MQTHTHTQRAIEQQSSSTGSHMKVLQTDVQIIYILTYYMIWQP